MKKLILISVLLGTMGLQAQVSSDPKGGDFTLKTPDGILKTEGLRNKILVIFFGFLHCPYVCPTTVRELNRVAKELPTGMKEATRFIFVTVDPERDSPEKLKQHFSKFGPNFIPAYGTHKEVRRAMKLFGGDFKVEKGKTRADYSVDHTSDIFIVNPQGVWVDSLPYNSKASEIKQSIFNSPSMLPYWTHEAKLSRIRHLGENKACDLSSKSCEFITDNGIKYIVDISPRPVTHFTQTKISVKVENNTFDHTPHMFDLTGVELPMGILRPKLKLVADRKWEGEFTLPGCNLKTMNFLARLMLSDKKGENFDIIFSFKSYNSNPTLLKP